MIKLFSDPTTTDFTTNGDKILKPLYANVHEEDNGDYYLELDLPLDLINFVSSGAIIACPTPSGQQPFRIRQVEKTKHKIKVKAYHVFYDAENHLIENSYAVTQDCNSALDYFNIAAVPTSPFTTTSDITTSASLRMVRASLAETVGEIINRWGGHLVRNGFQIGVMNSVGADRGVTIRYAKNLRDISVEENWENVVTKLLPVGYDGTLIDGLYVESEKQYSIPYCKTVTFDQDINQDDYIDENGNLDEDAYRNALKADLQQQAENYVAENSVPRVNYTLSASVEGVESIGDVIEVIDERIGVNILTNVISYDYNPIRKKFTELEFGNFRRTLQGLMTSINNEVTEKVTEKTEGLRSSLTQRLEQATAEIWSALGDSYVVYDGDKILVLDRLPANQAVNCILIDSQGIGFSSTGINGTFNSAWKINGEMDMQYIDVRHLSASLISGGTLRLGDFVAGDEQISGLLELFDANNALIGRMSADGLQMFGSDGSYVLMNNNVGFAGFDNNNNKIYWADKDEFHMSKAVAEDEITLCNSMRFIPITIYAQDNVTIVNDGIGLVSTLGGN